MILKGTISIPNAELNLEMMLKGGQSFRWKAVESNEWIGVFFEAVWNIKQSENHIDYTVNTSDSLDHCETSQGNREKFEKKYENILMEYLRIKEPLKSLYNTWALADVNFKRCAVDCYGIRVLKQHPVENLFSFICSSNNNIPRISSLVEKLCKSYGRKIADINGQSYYSFPTISKLAPPSIEDDLRKAGFGYRAKFIQKSAEKLLSLGGEEWLNEQKNLPYSESKANLMTLPGIGAKVADCICLMSLNHLEAVPVDTHIFEIARTVYLPQLRSVNTVTNRVYNEIGDFFRGLYGPNAGWAHVILFCEDLMFYKARHDDDGSSLIQPGVKRKKKDPKNKNNKMESVSGKLNFSKQDLHLRVTLNCGQTYRWIKIGNDIWQGVFANRVWTLIQHEDHIEYTMVKCIPDIPGSRNKIKRLEGNRNADDKKKECEALLENYFRLGEPLGKFYSDWEKRDQHFKDVTSSFYGLRMTRQDIVENLFAFIFSPENTISEITSILENLCLMYGEKIGEVDGKTFYSFPDVNSLCGKKVAKKLRYYFGLRGNYVVKSAEYIVKNGGEKWFKELQAMDYEKAKLELMKLPGVEAKVADWICLTALDHLNAIPVDTHVFHIAKKHYLPDLCRSRTGVSKKAYSEIADNFRKIFGHFAGWAHTVLFYRDL